VTDAYILFQLAGTTYAVRSGEVHHLELVEDITPVPNVSSFVDGVVFSRNQVVPVVNLRARFGLERLARDARARLIVVETGGRRVGLLVDSAREFTRIAAEAIHPPQQAITGLSGRYLEGIATVDGRVIVVLDLAEVLDFTEAAIPA
jgi:purine-binding chemotaxis protein CheW